MAYEPMMINPLPVRRILRRPRRRKGRNPTLAVIGNPQEVAEMNPRRRRRRGLRRDAFGRFLPRRRNDPDPNPRRYRRRARRSRPVYRVVHRLVRGRRRRNPAVLPTMQTVAGIAIGALVVRAVVPRVTRMIPIPFLQTGWGQVISTVALGGAAAYAVGAMAGRRWGTVVWQGAVAVAAVTAADLIAGPPAPAALREGEETMSLGAYTDSARLALADGTAEVVDSTPSMSYYVGAEA
jgi:hypothetical protein